MVGRTEVVAAVAAAVKTWGGHRRTPTDADLLGKESLTGCTLEVLGLTDLIPAGPARWALIRRVRPGSPLAEILDRDAARLLNIACELDTKSARWSRILLRLRNVSADIATVPDREDTRARRS